MTASSARVLSRLEAESTAADAVNSLAELLASQADPEARAQCANTIASHLLTSSSGLDNLIKQLASSSAARSVCAFLISAGDAEKRGSPQDAFRRMLANSPHAAAAINAFTTDLDSTSQDEQRNACCALSALTFGIMSSGRTAAGSGAIKKLVQKLERGPAESNAPKDALDALNCIILGSGNRTQLASKSGAIVAATNILVLATPPSTVSAAVHVLHSIIAAGEADLPRNTHDANLLLDRLASVLARADISEVIKRRACEILSICVKKRPSLDVVMAAALAKVRAAEVLVQLASAPFPIASSMLGLLVMNHPEQAEAAVRAGAIGVAKRQIRNTDVMIRGAAGLVLHALVCAGPQYAAAIDVDDEMSIGSAYDDLHQSAAEGAAKRAASSGTCAACGASKGSGKDGSLQQCSACRKVSYCSRECQKGHWRKHKPHCSAVTGKA